MSVSMKELLKAGVHFGHRTRYWDPKMAPYIYGARNKLHIIDLEQTLPLFQDALNFVGQTAANKGKILFVGTKRNAQVLIRDYATRCGMPYVDHRWLGGMLTNYKTIRKSVTRLKELEAMRDDNIFDRMIKKEALQLSRELDKLSRSIGGIKGMHGLPDVLFVVDVGYENIAVTEANRLKIPVIGIVDTNNSPDGIDYIVPGNDDAMGAIDLYLREASEAIVTAVGSIVEEEVVEEPKVDVSSKKVTPKSKITKKVPTKKAAPASDAAKKAPAKKAAVKSDASEKAPAKKAAPTSDASKKEPAKKAAPKSSASKKESPESESDQPDAKVAAADKTADITK